MSGSDTTALRIEGRDALELLHRISTQALLDLGPGSARATLFCDFRGRLLHRAVVARTGDGAVWLLRDDAPGAPLAALVDRHVFREEVRIDDRSAALPVEATPSAAGAQAGLVRERDGVPVEVVAGGVTLALRAGPAPPLSPAGREERERERIVAGRAAHGHEIAADFHPFEVGLGGDVHLDKGCYTGQEALQRLVTYDSTRRRLVRISGAGAVPDTPAEVRCEGERAGVLTSAVAAAPPGGWVGLAVIRHEYAGPGRALEVGGASLAGAPHLFPLPRALGRP
jgi:folate-binding protein YgfZ